MSKNKSKAAKNAGGDQQPQVFPPADDVVNTNMKQNLNTNAVADQEMQPIM
jgi:hypothetical protein